MKFFETRERESEKLFQELLSRSLFSGEGKYKQFQFISDTELICTIFDSNFHKFSLLENFLNL